MFFTNSIGLIFIEINLKFSRSKFNYIITVNEPDIQAIFIRKIVSKFGDSRSMFVYVISHTDKTSYKYAVSQCVPVCVPINTRCGIHWDRKNKNFGFEFLKIGCY